MSTCNDRVYAIAVSPTTSGPADFAAHLAESLNEQTFLGLTLSNPVSRDDDVPRRQTVRSIELRGQPALQWSLDFQRRQTHENLRHEESIDRMVALLGGTYRNAHLFTSEADIAARIDKSGMCRITRSGPSRSHNEQPTSHDRHKRYLIPEGDPCAFLEALGVMTADGSVRKAKRAKFRQINRYLEFVEDIYEHLPVKGRLEVVDFGCGLSYLTFALHHLLSVIHDRDVRIRGVDRSETVISRCQQTAADLQLTSLEFTCGTIDSLPQDEAVHLAVSLHACDTASDDALAAAVRMQANVILAAPCCQHELFTQLDSQPLALLTRHGILKERIAALATDALRAAVLESCGYRTQVIEFIDTEHTPKNLLLRAIRRTSGGADRQTSSQIDELKQLLGVTTTSLETAIQRS